MGSKDPFVKVGKPCIQPPFHRVMSDTDTLLPNGKGVWIPIDHGVSDFPVEGLENLDELIPLIAHADAIVAQKGVVSRYSSCLLYTSDAADEL